jgi:outer membrane receptor protein involved in Fe transport
VARPLQGLQLSTALAWNASRSNETVANTRILKNDWLPGARNFTASTSIEYTRALWDDVDGFVRAEHQYVGKAYADFGNATAPVMPPYQLVNLRFGLTRGGWTATLYADNLFDSQRITTLNDTGTLAFRLRPRTIGINLAASF